MKLLKICDDQLYFDNGMILYSCHAQDCCESHFLDIDSLQESEFEFFEFDPDNFIRKVDGFGIELVSTSGQCVRIAGHGYNNGYYSCNLTLVIKMNGKDTLIDITECQDISG